MAKIKMKNVMALENEVMDDENTSGILDGSGTTGSGDVDYEFDLSGIDVYPDNNGGNSGGSGGSSGGGGPTGGGTNPGGNETSDGNPGTNGDGSGGSGGNNGGNSNDNNSNNSSSYSPSKAADYATTHAEDHSKGKCALYVRLAIAAGGQPCDGYPEYAYQYYTYLPTIGFDLIPTSGYSPHKGDIVVFQPVTGHPYGHIAIFNGSKWVSDFIQNGLYVNNAYKKGEHHYFRK